MIGRMIHITSSRDAQATQKRNLRYDFNENWHANNSRLSSKNDTWQRFANEIHESISLARHVDVCSTGGFSLSILMNAR